MGGGVLEHQQLAVCLLGEQELSEGLVGLREVSVRASLKAIKLEQSAPFLRQGLKGLLLFPAQPPALSCHLFPQRLKLFFQDLDPAPVLCHTGLKLLDLGVQRPSPSAVPILFLPPALSLQLLELQVLIGTLGHIQLFLHLLHPLQKPLMLVLWL